MSKPWPPDCFDLLYLPVWEEPYVGVPRCHKDIFTSVSPRFWQAWDSVEATPAGIATGLAEICRGLMGLAVAGQGLAAVQSKTSPEDLVTEVDIGLEGILRLWIARHFPEDLIIGEEGGWPALSVSQLSTCGVWIMDPIDGTSNYAGGSPDVVIQICRLVFGKPQVAVIALPFYGILDVASCDPAASWSGKSGLEALSLVGPPADTLVVSTEFREDRIKEAHCFQLLLQQLNAYPYRRKSIGLTVYTLERHLCFLFYKPAIKIWDIYPLFALFALRSPQTIQMFLYPLGASSADQGCDPFSLEAYGLFTTALAFSGRIGDTMVFPYAMAYGVDIAGIREACFGVRHRG